MVQQALQNAAEFVDATTRHRIMASCLSIAHTPQAAKLSLRGGARPRKEGDELDVRLFASLLRQPAPSTLVSWKGAPLVAAPCLFLRR